MKKKTFLQKIIVFITLAILCLAKPTYDLLFVYIASNTRLAHKFMNPDVYQEKWESVGAYHMNWDNDALKEGIKKTSPAILRIDGVEILDIPLNDKANPSFQVNENPEKYVIFRFNLQNNKYEVNNLGTSDLEVNEKNNQALIERTGRNMTTLQQEIFRYKNKFLSSLEKMKSLEKKATLISFLCWSIGLSVIYGVYLLIMIDWDAVRRKRLFKGLDIS
ncbi:hypothetical protein [Streptococcus oricebi]|uniref:Uncharacterized protein n=1 Tax=Streptococcus oricebi TaxID=1547447 RepID=A0ABS5B482_9STRE|nr:hypothetical protein [Streptococcus oricebi]MBP2623637.1 hypothetical protein [Streptococcus oricebi]